MNAGSDNLRAINCNLQALVARLIRMRGQARILPLMIGALHIEISQAQNCIKQKLGSAQADPDVMAYARTLQDLAKILPEILVSLHTRKEQLRKRLTHLRTFAEWSETHRTSR